MTYTGNVRVGGPADVRELPALVVSKLAVGPYDNNAYLLRCRASGAQCLIDAAAEPERLLDLAGPGGLDLVITTHAHADHWQGLAHVVASTGAVTIAHVEDAREIGPTTDRVVAEGDAIEFGDVTVSVIHLDGHTPGSIVLAYDDPEGTSHLFTGDCLFPGGVGNTQSDPMRFARLLNGVEGKIFEVYSDETWVYPGHGKDTVLGVERPHLAEWRARGW